MNKHKKLFAVLTLMCFMFTLMPLSAFANTAGSTPQAPANVHWVNETKGMISWTDVADNATDYRVEILKDGTLEAGTQFRSNSNYQDVNGERVYTVSIADCITTSGSYTFKVSAMKGGSANTAVCNDSVSVGDALDMPENLAWRNGYASWSPVAGASEYVVRYYKDGSVSPMFNIKVSAPAHDDGYMYDNTTAFVRFIKQNNVNASDTFTFEVRAVSGNLTQNASSESNKISSANGIQLGDYQGTLATPSGITWVKDNGKITGDVTFYPVANNTDMYHIKLYRDGELEFEANYGSPYNISTGRNIIRTSNRIYDSGTYYVEVGAVGDRKTTFNSETVRILEPFVYERPADELDSADGLVWRNGVATWNGVDGADSYYVNYLLDGRWISGNFDIKTTLNPNNSDIFAEKSGAFIRRVVNYNGSGDYTFTVTSISDEIHNVAHSRASAPSSALDLKAISDAVKDRIQSMMDDLEKGIDIDINSLTQSDSQQFAIGMATDPEIRDLMKQLEEKYKEKENIEVEVDVDADAAIQNQVDCDTIIIDGAAFNGESDKKIKLHIAKGEEKTVNKQYINCTYVNMDLQNGESIVDKHQDGSLIHPVRITMPVPKNIDPDKFRIIHFFSNGVAEEIYPELSADKKEASFVLTHFSTFVFAEDTSEDSLPNPVKGNESNEESGSTDTDSDTNQGSNGGGFYYAPSHSNTSSTDSSAESTDSSVTVETAKVDKDIVGNAEQAVSDNESVSVIGGTDCAVNIEVTDKNGKELKDFATPIQVSMPIEDALDDVTDYSKLTLAKVVTDENGNTTLIYMGGNYDAQSGTFTAYVDESGDYILVEDANIRKIELQVGNIETFVNGESKPNDVAPRIIDGHTYLPVRFIAELLGSDVDWNEDTRTVTITKDGVVLTLVIDEMIDGFGMAAVIRDDRTLAPVRYIAEMLDANVIWNPDTYEVVVVK